MLLGRFAVLPVVALAAVSLSACVFDLSDDKTEEARPTRIADDCPARDQGNWARMQAFLTENKTKAGWKVTDSGLQYKVLEEGKGARKPTWASTVQVRYRGTLIDGKLFDETKPSDPPAEFEAGGVIKGWQEALTMMTEGSKWQVAIPSELAYGCEGKGQIQPDQVLLFDIELLKIK